MRWVAASSSLAAGDTTEVVATDTPSYKAIIALKAFAKTHYVRGIPGPGGEEVFPPVPDAARDGEAATGRRLHPEPA